ncbi:ATP-binding protein, partial [Methylobacterium sp. BTF04]|uniref:AAA family ATPase n=1 Tax=Methylobacterium sp. BTF04 TaxID=2708300 RepID=UPI0013D53CD9
MIIRRINIRNYRSIRHAEILFEKQTAILGSNGAGKSTILRAIDRFYGKSTSVDPDDFFGRDWNNPIEIAITFSDLNESESNLFESRIHNGEMTVVRVFDMNDAKLNGRYFGMTRQCPDFQKVRSVSGAIPKREAFNALIGADQKYSELEIAKTADQVETAMREWENHNINLCSLARDDGQFFGFTNVAKGALQKATSFVFIPAIRDVSADAIDARGAVISRLMELVVRSAIQKRVEIRQWQEKASTEYRELTDPSKLKELGLLSNDLTQTLQVFYSDAGVALKWKATEDFVVPLPIADVLLQEDGFEGPVDRKGHGLQRAFILTLLQHLAKASSESDSQQNTDSDIDSLTVGKELTQQYALPGLILAIEEPELYQHPTKQRHFSKVLTQISGGTLPGVATQTQVIFASHSSLFVSMDRFEEIRLARRPDHLSVSMFSRAGAAGGDP